MTMQVRADQLREGDRLLPSRKLVGCIDRLSGDVMFWVNGHEGPLRLLPDMPIHIERNRTVTIEVDDSIIEWARNSPHWRQAHVTIPLADAIVRALNKAERE